MHVKWVLKNKIKTKMNDEYIQMKQKISRLMLIRFLSKGKINDVKQAKSTHQTSEFVRFQNPGDTHGEFIFLYLDILQ